MNSPEYARPVHRDQQVLPVLRRDLSDGGIQYLEVMRVRKARKWCPCRS
jgi:hypothetical protein